MPLPFAPGELVLLAGGLLIAAGGVSPFLFVPLAIVACSAGSFVGYSWARLVGEHGLVSLARRLHQQRNLERVSVRIRSAGWPGIGVSRLIPGLRIYTTLVAGALRVPRRDFLVGMLGATVVWVAVFTALGAAVGIPVEHFLSRVEKVAFEAVILIALGVGSYLTIRKIPPSSGAGLVRLPHWLRVVVAAVVDVAVVGSVVTGLLALVRRAFGFSLGSGVIEGIVALVVGGALYVLVSRRAAGGTVGESLLQTSYVSGRRLPRRPQEAWKAARALLSGSPDELRPAAELLRALADPNRLRLVRQLLDGPRTAEELAVATGAELFEVCHDIDRLVAAGALVPEWDGSLQRNRIRPDLTESLLEFLAAVRGSAPPLTPDAAPALSAATD